MTNALLKFQLSVLVDQVITALMGPLDIGGPEQVENIQRLEMKTHLQIITAFMGPLDTYKANP